MFIKFTNKILFSIVTLGFILSACSNDSPPSQASCSDKLIEGRIYGTSQKGPFQKGATVKLFELDENLHQTGNHYETVIDNNSGKYVFDSISIKGPYAWMVVNGNYINEYTGKASSQKITLNGLVELGDGKDININILSHLAFNRIYNLVQQGKSVSEAQKQAESEVLKAFSIEADDTPFEKMDIFSDDDADAKLLAISLIVLYPNPTDSIIYDEYGGFFSISKTNIQNEKDGGDINELIAQISYDIETNGTWDNYPKQSIANRITITGRKGFFKSIPEKLKAMGATRIPNFENYLKKFTYYNTREQDTLWGSCINEGEILKSTNTNTTSPQSKKICKKGLWMAYEGPRNPGSAPTDSTKYGSLTDERDGHIYKTLDIKLLDGTTATWMASLLEYEVPAKTDSLTEYLPGIGRTYTYQQILGKPDNADTTELYPILFAAGNGEKVQGICPNGWHIPNYQEWNKLLEITEKDSEIKDLLIDPQYSIEENYDSDETPLAYEVVYPFDDSFNILGENNREQELLSAWGKWTFKAIVQPFTRTSIINGSSYFEFDYYRTYPFALRCVKD